MSKKALLVEFTVLLKDFQSLRFLDVLYLSNNWLHSLFHHFLEYFVILVCLALFLHTCLIFDVNRLTMSSSLLQSIKLEVSRFLMIAMASLTNMASSSLFFGINILDEGMNFSVIGIDTVREA